MSMQYFMALEIARERSREAEAQARLRWGMEPEPSPGQRIAAHLANLARIVRRTASSRDAHDWQLEAAVGKQSRDHSVA